MANISQDNEKLFKMAAEKLNMNSEKLKKSAGNNGEKLLNKLSEKDKEKVSQVLSDPEMTKKILSSPKAKELLKNLFGEK